MQQPRPLNQEQGFILFSVLLTLLVASALVLVSIESFSSERHLSQNHADRQIALQLAESALRAGEEHIAQEAWSAEEFRQLASVECRQALCATHHTPAWERVCGKKLCLKTNGKELKNALNAQLAKEYPRYIIELIKENSDTHLYRVTAWASGKNAHSVVMLQSYVTASKEGA